jgi:hypothetical protein
MMNRIGTISLLALGVAALNVHALEARQSPYDKIAQRNLFQLHAAPILQPPQPTVNPPPKVTLTGITTILGKRLAFITIEGTKAHPGESMILAEREAANGIEVKGIDERAGVVRILNGGEWQILNFEAPKVSGMRANPAPMALPPLARSAQARLETFMTPEEQAALIELQRIKFQQEGNSTHKILPPTDLNPNE